MTNQPQPGTSGSQTAEYDRGDKFLYYRSIPEFREYLLVSQSEYLVERYFKTGERQWLLQEHRGDRGEISLDSLGISCAIAHIYQSVDLI